MRNIFPRWSNTVPVKAIIALGMTGAAVVAGITYYATLNTPGLAINPRNQSPITMNFMRVNWESTAVIAIRV